MTQRNTIETQNNAIGDAEIHRTEVRDWPLAKRGMFYRLYNGSSR